MERMDRIEGEVEEFIDVAPDVLFGYLLNFPRHPEWVLNLSKVSQVSPGPIGVGTVFEAQEGVPPVGRLTKVRMMRHFIVGLLGGAKPYSRAEITAVEHGRRIAWYAGIPLGDGYFNRSEWEFMLTAAGHGTQLMQRFSYQPQTPRAARMIGAAGVDGITSACAVNLAHLKLVAERQFAQQSQVDGQVAASPS